MKFKGIKIICYIELAACLSIYHIASANCLSYGMVWYNFAHHIHGVFFGMLWAGKQPTSGFYNNSERRQADNVNMNSEQQTLHYDDNDYDTSVIGKSPQAHHS